MTFKYDHVLGLLNFDRSERSAPFIKKANEEGFYLNTKL